MNKSPLNYLTSIAIIAILWTIFSIFMGSYLSESPNLSDKDPAIFANELRMIFGSGALASIISICYWFYYGNLERTAGDMTRAKKKWNFLFIFLIIISVGLTLTIALMNMKQGIQPKWFGFYFGVLSILCYFSFWIASFLMSPLTVKYCVLGRR